MIANAYVLYITEKHFLEKSKFSEKDLIYFPVSFLHTDQGKKEKNSWRQVSNNLPGDKVILERQRGTSKHFVTHISTSSFILCKSRLPCLCLGNAGELGGVWGWIEGGGMKIPSVFKIEKFPQI